MLSQLVVLGVLAAAPALTPPGAIPAEKPVQPDAVWTQTGQAILPALPTPVDAAGRSVRDTQGGLLEYAASAVPALPAGWPGEDSAGWLPASLARQGLEVQLSWSRGAYGTGIGATGLHVVDLNGDGTREIVASASGGGFGGNTYWYVVKHAANGYAQSWISPQYSSSVNAVRIADANQDGAPDVLIAYGGKLEIRDGATLSVLRTITTTASSMLAPTIADVDSDGALELVFCDSSNLYVYNLASGQAEWTGSGYGGSDLAVANVDGDAALEIIVAGGSSGWVLNGQTHAVEWQNPARFGYYVRAGDLDGDGKAEVVAGDSWYKITIYDADLQSPKYEIPIDLDLDALQLADVEKDGPLEIVYGDGQWGSVYVHNGATGALKWSVANPEHGVTDVAVGDTDGDGVNELLWGAGYSSTGPDYLFIADCATHQREWQSQDVSGPFYGLDYGDVDNDNQPELLYTCFESDSGYDDGLWFVHDARTMALEYQSPSPTGSNWTGLWRIRHANVDGDPQAEILVPSSVTYSGKLFCYDGITHAAQWSTTLPDGLTFRALQVGDVDGDGGLEVVAAPYREHTGAPGTYVFVFNALNGAEEWRSVSLGSYWATLSLLRIGKVDADANLELVVAEFGGGLWVYDGATHVQEAATADLDITALELKDRNADGIQEILVGSANGALCVIDADTGAIVETIGNYGGQINGLAVVDVNYDLVPDYIFGRGNRLYIYDGAAPATALWVSDAIADNVGQNDSLLVGDIDNDRRLEIVVNTGAGLAVYEIKPVYQDCNENGVPDTIDIASGTSQDCQPNGVPDECDIRDGTSSDATGNGIPDECDRDCNHNGIPDADDIAAGTSADCDTNGVPDECDVAVGHDCCTPGTSGGCSAPDIAACVCAADPYCCDVEWDETCALEVETLHCGACAAEHDCNQNGVPDACDISGGGSSDCDGNGLPDECDPDGDRDRVPNACDNCPTTYNPWQEDFDQDGLGDACDPDIDNDGVLNAADVCDYTPPSAYVEPDGSLLGDLDGDCDVDLDDVALLQARFTGPGRRS